MDLEFVSQWDNSESYTDLIDGLGYLINEIYSTNPALTQECLTRTVKPILHCLIESIQMASDKFDPQNMEAGELPKIDNYLVDDISDKLSIIGDLFKTCDKFGQC